MPDDTITLPRSFFNELEQKLKKISQTLDQIDILSFELNQLNRKSAEIYTLSITLRERCNDLNQRLHQEKTR